ncbi:hypothetical protein DFH06DRAFT_1466734, partial [Mycena polygramma]
MPDDQHFHLLPLRRLLRLSSPSPARTRGILQPCAPPQRRELLQILKSYASSFSGLLQWCHSGQRGSEGERSLFFPQPLFHSSTPPFTLPSLLSRVWTTGMRHAACHKTSFRVLLCMHNIFICP